MPEVTLLIDSTPSLTLAVSIVAIKIKVGQHLKAAFTLLKDAHLVLALLKIVSSFMSFCEQGNSKLLSGKWSCPDF
jgi:hypothetical protein